MADINTLMEDELSRAIQKMNSLTPGSDEYNKAADAVATLQKARIDELKEAHDHEEKTDRLKMEDMQHGDELVFRQEEADQKKADAIAEKRRFRVRTILDAAAIVVPAAVYGYFGIKSFKFEQTGSFCSQTSRWNLSNIFKLRNR